MHGPDILIDALSRPTVEDKFGNVWQYHSRSDKHGKAACWGIAFDLLSSSSLLRKHIRDGKVILGVNHTLRDYGTTREKRLDLVFARPEGPPSGETFGSLAVRHDIRLTAEQAVLLEQLPTCPIAPVGAVLIGLEAKATMTAHIRALPRLYDELTSSHVCIHGASRQALAIGFVMINASPVFISADRNRHDMSTTPPLLSYEPQPKSLERTLAKVHEILRRSNVRETGFDGLGVVVIDGVNDGSPYHVVSGSPAPAPGSAFHYASMITRMANEYDTTFSTI